MKIKEFDRLKGIYAFELGKFETAFHAHPAIEMLFSKNGGIQIETPNYKFKEVCFAIIDANTIHKMVSSSENIKVLMIETDADFFKEKLLQYGMSFRDGIYTEDKPSNREVLFEEFYSFHKNNKIPQSKNPRILACLNYLDSPTSDYKEMVEILKSKTKLSKSRISHVFKEEMGLSMKKYLVWSRLKKAFELVVSGEENMYEASLQSGFYDQAHLSKAFKQMLGMSPSVVYNSRMIQA